MLVVVTFWVMIDGTVIMLGVVRVVVEVVVSVLVVVMSEGMVTSDGIRL